MVATWIDTLITARCWLRDIGRPNSDVLLHPFADTMLPQTDKMTHEERLEQACEYFAACLLMPRLWIKRAYYNEGIQDVASLGRLFNISRLAVLVRLQQLGLVSPPRKSAA